MVTGTGEGCGGWGGRNTSTKRGADSTAEPKIIPNLYTALMSVRLSHRPKTFNNSLSLQPHLYKSTKALFA